MKCIDHYMLKSFVILVALLFLFHNGVQKQCTVFTAACVRKERKWIKSDPSLNTTKTTTNQGLHIWRNLLCLNCRILFNMAPLLRLMDSNEVAQSECRLSTALDSAVFHY